MNETPPDAAPERADDQKKIPDKRGRRIHKLGGTHRSQATPGWMWANREAWDLAKRAADTNGLIVYLTLARLESEAPLHCKDAFAASLLNIKDASGLSVSSIKRVLPILAQANLISYATAWSSTGPSKDGPHTANLYRLLERGSKGGGVYVPKGDSSSQRASDTSSEGATHWLKKAKKNEPHKRNSSPEGGKEKIDSAPAGAGLPAAPLGGNNNTSEERSFGIWQ